MKLKKGDKVRVMTGKDKGREGKIEKIFKASEKILIPGLNLYKRHIKKNEKMPQGGIVDVPRALNVAKVMLICPKCGKLTRAGYKIEKDRKTRICRKCESKI